MGLVTGFFVMVGILLFLVLLCMAAIWMERKFPSEKYDERQKNARGYAYRLSFWVGAIYYLVLIAIMIRQVDRPKTVEPYLMIFWGFLLQVMAMHIYCILTHASLPLSEKPGVSIICYLFCGIFYSLTNDLSAPLSLVGQENSTWTGITMSVSFFALALMHLIQYFRDRKECDG